MMGMTNPLRSRQSIWLKGYDYKRAGGYFVTICTWQRDSVFGNMFKNEMHLNDCGRIVEKAWLDLPHRYPLVELNEFIVMPDHFHGILFLIESPQELVAKQHGLPENVKGFKSQSAHQINPVQDTKGILVWQRGYYDRIIRNESEKELIRKYISSNPIQWGFDKEYPPNDR